MNSFTIFSSKNAKHLIVPAGIFGRIKPIILALGSCNDHFSLLLKIFYRQN